MAGLDPAIHAGGPGAAFGRVHGRLGVDARNSGFPEFRLMRTEVGNSRLRDKPGHDDGYGAKGA